MKFHAGIIRNDGVCIGIAAHRWNLYIYLLKVYIYFGFFQDNED